MHVFWGMKKLVQLKFVQLLLLNRVKGKMIKKPCCSRFLLHKFVQLKYFWTQFKNVHLQGPCSLRPCISRPYCIHLFHLQSGNVKYLPLRYFLMFRNTVRPRDTRPRAARTSQVHVFELGPKKLEMNEFMK